MAAADAEMDGLGASAYQEDRNGYQCQPCRPARFSIRKIYHLFHFDAVWGYLAGGHWRN
jgi:hypothetical protein